MANKKKQDEALAAVQAQTEENGLSAAQSGYSAAGLGSRSEVENALANASYKPSQTVTSAENALKEWQTNRPDDYESRYQDKIDQLLGQLLQRGSFQYSYTKDPLYRQYEQNYLQNAHNASADAAAQAAALTGGYGSSYAASVAQQAYQQQIGALNQAIPTLYQLALDTYDSGGDALVSQLDQLNTQEQNAQGLYQQKLSDYYTRLEQLGNAYNTAYQQDYSQYQDCSLCGSIGAGVVGVLGVRLRILLVQRVLRVVVVERSPRVQVVQGAVDLVLIPALVVAGGSALLRFQGRFRFRLIL